MLPTDHNSLSDEQKRLVSAFNAAAEYFVQRVLDDPEIIDHPFRSNGSLSEIRKNEIGQVNSAIADEALKVLNDAAGFDIQNLDYHQPLKKSGQQRGESLYFDETIPSSRGEERLELVTEFTRRIEKELLMRAYELRNLPKAYYLEQIKPRLHPNPI